MTRREPSAATDDSQKENTGVRTKSSAEKVKFEKVTRSRRGARVEEEQIDEERHVSPAADGNEEENGDAQNENNDINEDDDQGEGSSHGRKRARANSFGDSRPSAHDKGKAKAEPRTLPRDDDGYIPGSILRVKLENFVTYDWVEFNPGPYLNMILGPNGTGKSSIACAICIGLNFPPSTLGRATEIGSFVKIDTEHGATEIELKGPKGKRNIVIRRELKKGSKSSQFFINGQKATAKEVSARIQELNVQVSNLCSFLPQDKVAEFARMSPQELLRETQLAAGNSHLTAWHDLLIEKGKELKKMREDLTVDREQLRVAEERNANLEREVRAYEERRKMELEIEFLELLLPFRQYNDAKDKYMRLKDHKNELGVRVKKLQKKNAPITKLKAELEQQYKDLDAQRDAKKNEIRRKFNRMQQIWVENERLETDAENLKNKLDNLKREEKDRQRKIERLERDLESWRNEVDNPPDKEDTAALEGQKRAVSEKMRRAKIDHEEILDQQRRSIQQEAFIKQRIDNANLELQKLNSADHQKLANLGRWDKDCADTVVWLRENKHRFRMEIFEPPFLSVNISDKRFTAAIEACFGGNEMKSFVMQCDEDYKLFNHLVVDTSEALGRKARLNTWFRHVQTSPPPVSKEELQSMGFDGYAIEYMTYPEGMEMFLQNALSLHRTPLAVLTPNRVNPGEAMDRLSHDGGVRYIIGNVMNIVTRSRYGQRLAQNATLDQEGKHRVEQELREAQDELAQQEGNTSGLGTEEKRRREEHKKYKAEEADILARMKKIVDIERRLHQLRSKITSGGKQLNELRNARSMAEERASFKRKIIAIARDRLKLVDQYNKLLRVAIQEQTEATKLGLQFLQVGARKIALESIYEVQEQALSRAMEEFKEAQAQYAEAKTDSKNKLTISKAKLDAAEPEVRDKFRAQEEAGEFERNPRPVEEIQMDLETKKAELDLNMHTNAGVVDTYKKRQAEIATLSQKIENQEEKAQKVEQVIKRTRDLWEPELTRLVESIGEKFSNAFDRIGCAGQINVAQHEDFDKWAIEILVKFRDEEKLQLLTAERQSGGERSLTTILYLMSLTEHARAPFSLVDEINQGMDSRAERAVHDSLVEVTCKPDSGQYFLITPKLLADLTYHERMKVLCVSNGEWIPEDKMTGNMMSMIDAYVQTLGGGAA
ncbi:hypothetical protein NM688_g3492 [Phlebia brevispora]|uniref:Uncharacterized protein n=1 Tax=Phlebia brevispora TaxID=194682 RepID=A0ACC1T600_9APHY|nr:hypothetical protein NM688_g3492 [Phlebia brevispora]